MSHANDRFISLKINALNGVHAAALALDAGGDLAFPGPGETSDDEELDDTCQARLADEKALGGYEITLVRRGYSNSPGASEYTAEYGVAEFVGPGPLFGDPDITDTTHSYVAALQSKELSSSTQPAPQQKHKQRL